jgi:hypothetical protein
MIGDLGAFLAANSAGLDQPVTDEGRERNTEWLAACDS